MAKPATSTGRARLATHREALAEGAGSDRAGARRQVDQQPVEEVDPRQVGRHFAAGLVDVVALARHVEVVADQGQRAGAVRQVAPREMRADVVGEGRAFGH
jgi:hypothetical protein